MTKPQKFRELLLSPKLEFICEAHNGLSARIVEEAGFPAVWASGLTMSAALGVRDSNESSWTQVLEILEFMSDATHIPILVDADTGYGNFNNVRRLVRKLEQRGVAAICIEDKRFPKTNSLLKGGRQELADIDEFCGRIKAAKDTQLDRDFTVVARNEAFIAGHGLEEAIKRAEAYRVAGADAILIHSKSSKPDEVLGFKKEWGDRLPVIIVPTTYYATPTDIFRDAGFSMVIWANMILRGSIRAMQETVTHLANIKNLHAIDDRIAPLSEVFRLQRADELADAEKKYLPAVKEHARALILAASRGEEFGVLTEHKPKAMLEVAGQPLIFKQIQTLREMGIKDITIVRGFQKDMIQAPNVRYIDNDNYSTTKEVVSLKIGLEGLPKNHDGKTFIAFGDLLFKKFIPSMLLEAKGDIVLAIDPNWEESIQKDRYMEYVMCSEAYKKALFDKTVMVKDEGPDIQKGKVHAEWFGLFSINQRGLSSVMEALESLSRKKGFHEMRMSSLFRELIAKGVDVRALYINGHWLDVDDIKDYEAAHLFWEP